MVGNPPFAGKNTLATGNRTGYGGWLQTLHEGAHGNADLVSHFFRRAFTLLRTNGVFGLIVSTILGAGGNVLQARRRLRWPGEAAVVVSVIHITKGKAFNPVLDGKPVRRISASWLKGIQTLSRLGLLQMPEKRSAVLTYLVWDSRLTTNSPKRGLQQELRESMNSCGKTL